MNVRQPYRNTYLAKDMLRQNRSSSQREQALEEAAEHLTTQMRRFSNAASKKLGDTTVDRQHLTFCVQAALTGDQPGVLEFSSHSPGCASLPLELLEALNSAANLQNSPVRTVILPPGLTEMPQWLKVLPIKRLVVPEFARKSLDLGGQLPPGAQIQVVAPLDEKIEVTGFDPDMTQLEILPKTSVLMDVQNKV